MDDETLYGSRLDQLFDLVKLYPFSATLYLLRTHEPEDFKRTVIAAIKELKENP